MVAQDWLSLLPALAAGGLLAVIGCVLIRAVVSPRPLRRKMMVEVVVAVVLSQGLAATVLSGDVSMGAKIALSNLAATALVTVWWWSPWTSSRRTQEPTLVFQRGQFVRAGLRRCRLTEEDVLAALRSQGVTALRAADSVVAEPDGSISLWRTEDSLRSALQLVWSRDDTGSAETPRHPHVKCGQ